ncbi:component of SufBCD complex [Ovoidimarina sediminis]|uniref:component of SufBCD complex n=1 Tax=Ovoidimarina sediminis TaxID=3079856 RepID=UPI00292DECFE|nr:component of SufBCD complex [Rhodophyticola sp. MJ-SS7]
MDWYQTVFELIDLRSFSNLWYWIALAVLWSTSSHWILGVPFDLVQRASRYGGEAETDLNDLVRINVNRILYLMTSTGTGATGFIALVLAMLVTLGFFYSYEFAQATFFLVAPMSLIGALNVWTARKIRATEAAGAALYTLMWRHRRIVQGMGVVWIFVTGVWGMSRNMLVTGPF